MSTSYNCSVPCHKVVDLFSACPTREVNSLSITNMFEVFMVFLSMTPYPLIFSLCFLTLIIRTTRIAFVVIMLFIDYFSVEIMKYVLKEPRPNFVCNHEYGNPSNHTCFYTGLVVWFVMEFLFLERKYRFNNTTLLNALFVFYPFIVYSRYYLGYHSLWQILVGFMLGVSIAVVYFILVITCGLKWRWIAVIYKFFWFTNSMSNDYVEEDKVKNA